MGKRSGGTDSLSVLDLNGCAHRKRLIHLMLQKKGSLDFLESVTDGIVEWRMLNMNSELVTASLSRTIGPGIHNTLSPHWNFNAKRGDGVVPLNNILRFETFGDHCPLGTKLQQKTRLRLVTTRDENGRLKRGHLAMNCELFNKDADSQRQVGRAEFWMALTRPLAPPGQHKPTDVPEALKFLKEHEAIENDLVSRDIESYRCRANADGQAFHDTMPLVFHIDRSDIYRHINTSVYMNQAQDYLALLYHKVGGDAGRLRFRGITIYFRKPFVPGQAAEIELDLVEWKDRFHGAVRFYHSDGKGSRSERISVAMETRGPLAES